MKKSNRGRLASALGAVALVASSMFLASPAYAADEASLFVACQPGDPGVAAFANLTVTGPTDVGFLIDGASQGTATTVDVGTPMPITPPPRVSVSDGPHTVQFWVGTTSNTVGAPLLTNFPSGCGGDNSGGDPSASISSFGATASGNEAPRSIALQGEAVIENVDDESVTVSFTITGPTTLTAPNATVNSDGSFSSSVSGQTIPDGTYTVTAQVLINGTPSGSPSSTTVTFTAPPVDPDPVPATVGGTFTGVLVDNTSTVNYSVTVTPNDDEGPFVAIIRDGDGNIVEELTFTEGGTQTGSFIYECGAAAFTVTFEGDEPGEPTIITVPCHVPDGGGNPGGGDNSGGNNGGNNGGNGGTGGNNGNNGGNTGGTGGTGGTDGTNTNGGNTSGGSTNTDNASIEAPPGAATGDTGPIVWVIGLGIALMAAAGFVLARRKGVFALIGARCMGILAR